MMIPPEIFRRRLANQRLTQAHLQTPADVVAWLGAVQAQEYPGGLWALGLRLQSATQDTVDQAFNDGTILRTHVLRPTWHFVTPADIRWLLALTSARVHARITPMYRRLELDAPLLARSEAVIARELQDGRHRTRAELGAALSQAGISTEELRLGHLLIHAELEGLMCSGPRRGKQFTYALLEERAPQAKTLSPDEALAELVRRYYTSHGPATVQDFAWWSSLTVAGARRGLELAAPHLDQALIDGQTYYFGASQATAADQSEADFLLPTYDEFLVGYRSFDRARRGGQEVSDQVLFNSAVLTGERIVGSWRRTFLKGTVAIEIAPFAPLSPEQAAAVATAARRYGAFLGMQVQLSFNA